jgi:hypothetical protein
MAIILLKAAKERQASLVLKPRKNVKNAVLVINNSSKSILRLEK